MNRQLVLFLCLGAGLAAPEVRSQTLDWSALRALKGPQGLLFAEKPGGRVTLSGDAAGTLPEGTSVGVGERTGGIGGGTAEAAVRVGGKDGMAPSPRVITADSLQFSPTGDAVIHAALTECGDFCYSEIWLLTREGKRYRLTAEGGPNPVVAWSPKGDRVAVGSRGLWVGPAAGPLTAHEKFTAPAFAPNGDLYVRGADTDDAVYLHPAKGKARRVLNLKGRHPESEPEADFGDPWPVTFKDGHLVATFHRGGGEVTRRKRILRAKKEKR